jgi:hydroxyacylglutathione hydrolase
MASESRIMLRQVEIGPMANYVYLIGDTATRKAAVVDPAWNVDGIIDLVNREGYDIDKILITHYHPDHLGGRMMGQTIEGAAEMLEKVKAKIYLNKHEAEGARKVAGLSESDIVKVDAGDTFKLGELEVKFLHTPGHTPGSQCFLVEGNLVSGDTLFVNSCGRVDLPGSDPEAMYHSLNDTLRNLDDATVVYPGHAYSSEPSSTIGKQKRTNMYMRFANLDDFLEAMGYSR